MPRLMRTVARTAVVAGTATAVSNRVSRRQAGRWAQQEQAPPPEAAPPPAPVAAPASAGPSAMDTQLAQLRELGELKSQGVLSEAEFEFQKNKILNS